MEFTRFADLAKRPGHPKMDRNRRLPLSNAPGLTFIRYPEVVGNVQFVMEPNLVVDAGRVPKKGHTARENYIADKDYIGVLFCFFMFSQLLSV